MLHSALCVNVVLTLLFNAQLKVGLVSQSVITVNQTVVTMRNTNKNTLKCVFIATSV